MWKAVSIEAAFFVWKGDKGGRKKEDWKKGDKGDMDAWIENHNRTPPEQ
ncbi:hypothetical protein [Flavihumibacter cheonanensis]|nr:hypothetical protein [Flavihumibacter cheonanensis]MCG7751292.1 hypothetical protein [Flavihumibacter cheonanensis]